MGSMFIGTLGSAILLGVTYIQTFYYFIGKLWSTFFDKYSHWCLQIAKRTHGVSSHWCATSHLYPTAVRHVILSFSGSLHCIIRHSSHVYDLAYRYCSKCFLIHLGSSSLSLSVYHYLVSNYKYASLESMSTQHSYCPLTVIHLL